jgi:hypothetical protein
MSDTIPRAEIEELYSRAIVLIAAFLREDFQGIAALEGEEADKLLPHFGAFPCFPGPTGSPQLPFPALPAARGQGMSIGALIKGDAVLPSEGVVENAAGVVGCIGVGCGRRRAGHLESPHRGCARHAGARAQPRPGRQALPLRMRTFDVEDIGRFDYLRAMSPAEVAALPPRQREMRRQ